MSTFKNLLKLYRNSSYWTALQHRPTALSTQFFKDFDDFYPRLIDKTIERAKYLDHPTVKDFLQRMAKYYVRTPMEGELIVHAYELLEKPENINDEALHQVYSIACCAEMLQNYLYFLDDILDDSLSRAGKTCWYLSSGSSPLAIKDCFILRSLGNEMLKQNVKEEVYVKIMDLKEDCYLFTEMGQCSDAMISKVEGYNHYTMDNYQRMCGLKASFFAAIYPVQVALILCNKANEKSFQLAADLLNNFGIMTQIHNDFTEFVDYNESMSMKSNNDIQRRKCSWNAVTALQHFNREQRKTFEECYGSSDPEKVKQVIDLYEKIDLVKLFRQAENSSYEELLQKIKGIPTDSIPSPDYFIKIKEFFQSYLSNINRYYYI